MSAMTVASRSSEPQAEASGRGGGIGPRGENIAIRVPTYNCAELLRVTLRSLIDQGDALADATVEVIDDCSTKDDPEAVVREFDDPRVTFYRHPENVGPIRNFNSCIDRALATGRRWIHILHGDDFVLPGYYETVRGLQERFPRVEATFVRSVVGDVDGVWTSLSERLGDGVEGVLSYDPLDWGGCPIQFAGAVFSREAVAKVGRFDEHFCHVSDWDMWRRLARDVPVAYSNECLAFYRVFAENHSSGLKRKAINLREVLEELERVEADVTNRYGGVSREHKRRVYIGQYHRAKEQCGRYLGDPEAFAANLAALKAFPVAVRRWRDIAGLRFRSLRPVR